MSSCKNFEKRDSKKSLVDFVIIENIRISDNYSLIVLKATDNSFVDWGHIYPGQFVQVEIIKDSFALRRPISIHDVDPSAHVLSLLVRVAGKQTSQLCTKRIGEIINIVIPLGNGFDITDAGKAPLLIGGGVDTAPLLYLGKILKHSEITPTFLLAARTERDLLRLDAFRQYGEVLLATDDGSIGHHGFAAEHPELKQNHWTKFYCCGPIPMMKSIASIALSNNILCEVSLENTMACGLGACLCCVEDTRDKGNVCVCTEGPVFNIRCLNWF